MRGHSKSFYAKCLKDGAEGIGDREQLARTMADRHSPKGISRLIDFKMEVSFKNFIT